jgi:hypothetical protein
MADETLKQLQDRIDALERLVATMRGRGGDDMLDPFRFVLLARRDGDNPGDWREQTVNNGTVEDFPDGRTGSNTDSPIIPAGAASAILEVIDAGRCRYVDIGTRYFPVALAQDGGADATGPSDAATYTYTVTDESGTQLGTTVSPEILRENGRRVVATKGQAYYDKSNNLKLWMTDERKRTTPC